MMIFAERCTILSRYRVKLDTLTGGTSAFGHFVPGFQSGEGDYGIVSCVKDTPDTPSHLSILQKTAVFMLIEQTPVHTTLMRPTQGPYFRIKHSACEVLQQYCHDSDMFYSSYTTTDIILFIRLQLHLMFCEKSSPLRYGGC